MPRNSKRNDSYSNFSTNGLIQKIEDIQSLMRTEFSDLRRLKATKYQLSLAMTALVKRYTNQGEFELAIPYYYRILRLKGELKDARGMGFTRYWLIYAYCNLYEQKHAAYIINDITELVIQNIQEKQPLLLAHEINISC